MKKIKEIINKPWWGFVGCVLGFFTMFGLISDNTWSSLMQFGWVADATKWSLICGAFIFGLYAYLNSRKSSKKTIPTKLKNNPDLFPGLNATALKKHIGVKVNQCPYNNSILRNIYLFEGTPFRYLIVVDANSDNKDYYDFREYWSMEPESFFENHFIEVYRNESPHDIWVNWTIMVIDGIEDLSSEIALKTDKWILYGSDNP